MHRATIAIIVVSAAAGCGRTGLDQPPPAAEATEPAARVADHPGRSVGLTAGLFHSCVALAGGHVECWGFNNRGQLGDGTTDPRTSPTRVRALDAAVSVTGGRDHTCALLRDGSVACWGGNARGQLGGATADLHTGRPAPLAVPGTSVEVSAGGAHACALLDDGTLRCFGADDHGQLGGRMDPTHVTRFRRPDVPPVSTVSAGWQHTCAVLESGRVACWGSSDHGRLGDPDADGSVDGVRDAVAVSAGDYHACAVTGDGAVWCWGDDAHGQLGRGHRTAGGAPAPVSGITDAVDVAAGHEHTCALHRSGTVSCWGRDEHGQLGDGGALGRSPTPVAVPGVSRATAVAAGWRHACALEHDGRVTCWGRNVEGQLGTGATSAVGR